MEINFLVADQIQFYRTINNNLYVSEILRHFLFIYKIYIIIKGVNIFETEGVLYK